MLFAATAFRSSAYVLTARPLATSAERFRSAFPCRLIFSQRPEPPDIFDCFHIFFFAMSEEIIFIISSATFSRCCLPSTDTPSSLHRYWIVSPILPSIARLIR